MAERLDSDKEVMPSDVTPEISFFDKLASYIEKFVSKALFFNISLAICIIWLFSFPLFNSVDSWQLVINTGTTVITYLLVSLLSNTQYRGNKAIHHKLNAISESLADILENTATPENLEKVNSDIAELRQAVGLEDRESA